MISAQLQQQQCHTTLTDTMQYFQMLRMLVMYSTELLKFLDSDSMNGQENF